MTKSKLRKIAIVLSSLAVLSAGFGVDTAYARGGGGFGGGHIGGFGGGHIGGLGGGGFGGGRMGGIGGAHIGSQLGGGHLSGGFGGDRIGADHMGSEFGGGHSSTGLVGDHMGGGVGDLHTGGIRENHTGIGGDLMDRGSFGTDHFGAPSENHVDALAGVHPGATNFDHSRDHRRVREENATSLLCEDAIMVDPACSQTNPLNTP